MSGFNVGQMFIDDYPEESAAWCNDNGKIIVEIERQEGHRRFQIQEVPEPTAEEIAAEEEARRNSTEQRLSDIEDALVELASIIAGA